MSKDIKVPTLGESVVEATIAKWFKNEGDSVVVDEPLVELETDKVTVEVPAPASGKLEKIVAATGSTIAVGGLLGTIAEGAVGTTTSKTAAIPPPAPVAAKAAEQILSPAVRKAMVENKIAPTEILGTGKEGRITKGDVISHLEKPAPAAAPVAVAMPAAAATTRGAEERVKMSRLRLTISETE